MKILLFGSSGRLGKYLLDEFVKNDQEILNPSHRELSLDNLSELEEYILKNNPDIIINVAGKPMETGTEINFFTEKHDEKTKNYVDNIIKCNVQSMVNLVLICNKLSIKLIYTSSEYVFYGDEGNYTIHSPVNPKNLYGYTKVCGEMLTRTLSNYLIIRPPLIRDVKFEHPKAFTDQYCSRQYVDKVAKSICEEILYKNTKGIIHICGNRKSLFDIARETVSNIESMEMPENIKLVIPVDTSLV